MAPLVASIGCINWPPDFVSQVGKKRCRLGESQHWSATDPQLDAIFSPLLNEDAEWTPTIRRQCTVWARRHSSGLEVADQYDQLKIDVSACKHTGDGRRLLKTEHVRQEMDLASETTKKMIRTLEKPLIAAKQSLLGFACLYQVCVGVLGVQVGDVAELQDGDRVENGSQGGTLIRGLPAHVYGVVICWLCVERVGEGIRLYA